MQTILRSRKRPSSTEPSALLPSNTLKRSENGSRFPTAKLDQTIYRRWDQLGRPGKAIDFFNWYKHLLGAGLSVRQIQRSNLEDLTIPTADRMELLKARLRKRKKGIDVQYSD